MPVDQARAPRVGSATANAMNSGISTAARFDSSEYASASHANTTYQLKWPLFSSSLLKSK